MDHGHEHDLEGLQTPAIARRLRLAGFAVIALAVVAVAAMWPRGDAPDLGMQPQRYVKAEITSISTGTCPGIEVIAPTECRVVSVRLLSGSERGDRAGFTVLATQFDVPELEAGDEVVLLDSPAAPPEFRYAFIDFERSIPLIWLGVVFAGIVMLFGRWQGLRALCGLAASVLLLVLFLVPALLRDQPAVPVALAGAAAIACLALYLAHGFNTATTVALLGALSALLFIAVLAQVVVTVAQISGLADPDAQVLRVTAASLDLRGLLIAGIVIGALGSLDDVTVTQVSTVAALRRANPDLPRSALYREAIAVGRDHVASSVNTLVLAYAGAGLPLLIFFVQGNQPIARILGGELIAIEIVRTLVGSIGLILSVPAPPRSPPTPWEAVTPTSPGGTWRHRRTGPRPGTTAVRRPGTTSARWRPTSSTSTRHPTGGCLPCAGVVCHHSWSHGQIAPRLRRSSEPWSDADGATGPTRTRLAVGGQRRGGRPHRLRVAVGHR